MQDSFNLSRFVEAQRRVFSRVMDEPRGPQDEPLDVVCLPRKRRG